MTAVFEYWRHCRSGEIYAARLEAGELTGIFGPIHYRDAEVAAPRDFHFDDRPDEVAWATAALDDFSWHNLSTDPEES